MRLFRKLRKKLNYLPDFEVRKIHQAYMTAMEAHRGQKRQTGESYITHPVAVSMILADMRMDQHTIMAALLHDVIEDTAIEKTDLENRFGTEVANLVDGVSKLTQIEFVSRAEAQAENFRKMLFAMAHDIRVIIVKLADRLHNMRTLGTLLPEKKHRISKETLEIFAPIAKRLGMRDFSVELEELAFAAMNPHRYRILKEAVQSARGNRKKVLALINKTLHEGLIQKNFPPCTIIGREKHLYSIYRKMRVKKLSFSEIMDVYAFRIIVDSVDTCYRTLGLVHQLFKPVPERFKDYIAIPKANGYQSLHTTLFGPYGLPIEIQIRTTEMDRIASSGIAAHWLYKSDEEKVEKSHIRAQAWVKNLLALQQESGSSLEFIENVKVDLFPEEVYIFTPKGDIKALPSGANGVDFAYAVHTDVGNHCVAIKINRHIAPLTTKLSNGDTVEVVTASSGRPNPGWLSFVVTSKARSAIRHYLKTQERASAVALGKKLLQKTLRDFSVSLKKVPDDILQFLLKETKLPSFDDLCYEIGLGNRAPALVAQRIAALLAEKSTSDTLLSEEDMKESGTKPLIIEGTEGLLLDFATCCDPIPGDPIIGVLQPGKGILVHTEDCKRITKLLNQPEHCVPLCWADDINKDFTVKIGVLVRNERGVLAILALAVSDAGSNIEDINLNNRDGEYYGVEFKVLVKNRNHLAKVLKSLRLVPQVDKIVRVKR